MLFSENMYFLILFTLPASLNIIYNAHIRHASVLKNDKSVELAECTAFCFAVFMGNILIMRNEMKLFAQYSMLAGNEIQEFLISTNFDYIKFMTNYFIMNLKMSIIVLVVWYTLGQFLFREIRNILNKMRGRPKELKFSDVWTNIFETDTYVDMENCVIKIERSGKLVTAGLVSIYSAPNLKNKEFALCDTDLIRQLFEDDEALPFNLRMFRQAECEYYDIQADVLIKFYNAQRYEDIYGEKEPN